MYFESLRSSTSNTRTVIIRQLNVYIYILMRFDVVDSFTVNKL